MCGRFTLSHSPEQVAERFGVQEVLFEFSPRYNIAPSQPIPVVRRENAAGTAIKILDACRWGLVPSWSKDPDIGSRLINARAETVAEKPSFKHSLLRRRCLIPADGFYEWMRRTERGGRSTEKQPMHIHMASGEIFAFAGLWDEWQSPGGPAGGRSPLRTCTIITTAPNSLMRGIHDRMPAILRPEDEALWLDAQVEDAQELLNLLQPYPDEALQAHRVSTAVNTPDFDSPQCIEAIVADDDGGTAP